MKALTREQIDSYRHDGFLFSDPRPDPAGDLGTYTAGLERPETSWDRRWPKRT